MNRRKSQVQGSYMNWLEALKYLHSLNFKLNFYGSYLNRLKAPKQFRPILGQATAEGSHLKRLNAQNNLGSLKLKLHCPT